MVRTMNFGLILFLVLNLISLCWLIKAEAFASEIMEVEGTFDVLISDHFYDSKSEMFVFLNDKDSLNRYNLDMDSLLQVKDQLRTGKSARVALKKSSVIDSGPYSTRRDMNSQDKYIVNNIEFLDDLPINTGNKRDAIPAFNAIGVHRLLLIVLDFEDEQVKCSREDIASRVFGSISTASQATEGPWENVFRTFQLNSAGRFIFGRNHSMLEETPQDDISDVVGPFKVPGNLRDYTECAYESWATLAQNFALDAGVELSRYKHISIILPDSEYLHQKICRWNGLAYVGCPERCKSWISGCNSLGIFAHELGHNAGLGHAGTQYNMEKNHVEYGDPTGIMGNQWSAASYKNNDFYFNVPHRIQMGWITQENIISISTEAPPPTSSIVPLVDGAETEISSYNPFGPQIASFGREYFNLDTARVYRIAPYHYPKVNGVYQTIQLFKGATTVVFYISYQSGENVSFPNHALVHSLSGGSSQTYLLAIIEPNTNKFENITMNAVRTLWRDPDLDWAVRVLQVSTQFMDVQITWKCQPRNPLIDILPSKAYTISETDIHQSLILPTQNTAFDSFALSIPNDRKFFNISFLVSNKDSDLCKVTKYDYKITVPQDMELKCFPASLTLSPGQTCFLNCSVFLTPNIISSPVQLTLTSSEGIGDDNLTINKTVLVHIYRENCQTFVPKISFDLPSRVNVLQGVPLVINGKLTNQDTVSCNSRSFDLGLETTSSPWMISVKKQDLSPGEITDFMIQVLPSFNMAPGTTFNNSIVLKTSASTSIKLDHEVIEATVIQKCHRGTPTFNLNITAVGMYVADALRAPARVTNMDSVYSDCGPTLFMVSLQIDPTRYVQSSIWPAAISLNPGDSFDFIVTVFSSDLAQTNQYENNGAFTGINLKSEVHGSQVLDFEVFLAPKFCETRIPAMGLFCLTNTAVVFNPGIHQYDIKCNFGKRNDDSFLCSYTVWNLTIASTSKNFASNTSLLSDVKTDITPVRIIPGDVVFQEVTLILDIEGLFEALNETNPGVTAELDVTIFDVTRPEPIHTGYISSTIKIGRCFILPIEIDLSPSNGPLVFLEFDLTNSTITEKFLLAPDVISVPDDPTPGNISVPDIAVVGPAEEVEPTEVLEEPTPIYETEPEPPGYQNTTFPVFFVPFGVAQSINFTVYNPNNEFCTNQIFTLELSDETKSLLKDLGVKDITLSSIIINPSKAENLTFTLKTPILALPERFGRENRQGDDTVDLERFGTSNFFRDSLLANFSDYLNLTFLASYSFQLSRHYTPPVTIFMVLRPTCAVYPLLWSPAPRPQEIDQPSVPVELEPTVPSLEAVPSPIEYYPTRFDVRFGETKRVYARLNLTNLDLEGCSDPLFNVPSSFYLSARRQPFVAGAPISIRVVSYYNDSWHNLDPNWDGISPIVGFDPNASLDGLFDIPPLSWKIFNITIDIPDNLDPGVNTITLVATSSPRTVEHTSTTNLDIVVAAPPPRPAWDLHAAEILSPIGVSVGYDVFWRACERKGECSCPCKYFIFRNGIYRDTVTTPYYPYRFSLSQAGVETTLKVIVQDVNGVNSTEETCGNMITFSPSDSPFAHLFIFLMLIAIAFFPALAFVLELLRHKNKLPLQFNPGA